MNYKPKGHFVLVKPDEIDEITKGGLYIPDTVREQHGHAITRGELVAIGPSVDIKFLNDDGTKRNAFIGERVIFAKFGGSEFSYDDGTGRVKYRVLYDDDILLSIDDQKEELGNSRKPVSEVK